MTPHVVRRLSPEKEELAAKCEELARLEAQLANQELSLASLKAELAAFEGLYPRRVGVLYAELDKWNARLASNVLNRPEPRRLSVITTFYNAQMMQMLEPEIATFPIRF